MDIDQLFSGMAKAQMFGHGNYMSEGKYTVELKSVLAKPRFKGGNVFIAEFTILESTSAKHPPGTEGSWCPKIELPNTFGDIKSLMFAVVGRDPKSVAPEDTAAHEQIALLAKAACGSPAAITALTAQGIPADFVKGRRVELQCTQIKTKEGKDFTRYTWAPYAGPPAAPAAQ